MLRYGTSSYPYWIVSLSNKLTGSTRHCTNVKFLPKNHPVSCKESPTTKVVENEEVQGPTVEDYEKALAGMSEFERKRFYGEKRELEIKLYGLPSGMVASVMEKLRAADLIIKPPYPHAPTAYVGLCNSYRYYARLHKSKTKPRFDCLYSTA